MSDRGSGVLLCWKNSAPTMEAISKANARGACLLSPSPPRASRDNLQQLLVASRGVATLVTLNVGCW